MNGWIYLIVILVIGYVIGRMWPMPGQAIGLP